MSDGATLACGRRAAPDEGTCRNVHECGERCAEQGACEHHDLYRRRGVISFHGADERGVKQLTGEGHGAGVTTSSSPTRDSTATAPLPEHLG